ncbi:hypothetical protein Noda2021_02160 [Candidatus Dependentiae bacterium Noda2021]|nr:hypothetical protein Noda2021_02160 [Candidatus Dependentiae bacterium Noda2021]
MAKTIYCCLILVLSSFLHLQASDKEHIKLPSLNQSPWAGPLHSFLRIINPLCARKLALKISQYNQTMYFKSFTYCDLVAIAKLQSKYERSQRIAKVAEELLGAHHDQEKPLFEAKEKKRVNKLTMKPEHFVKINPTIRAYNKKYPNLYKLRHKAILERDKLKADYTAYFSTVITDPYAAQARYERIVDIEFVINAISKAIDNKQDGFFSYIYDEKYILNEEKMQEFKIAEASRFYQAYCANISSFKKMSFAKKGYPIHIAKWSDVKVNREQQLQRSKMLVESCKLNFDESGNFVSEELKN